MNPYSKKLYKLLNSANRVLKKTYKMFVPLEVLDMLYQADYMLESTDIPLYELHKNNKEDYNKIIDFKETARSYLYVSIQTIKKYGNNISCSDFSKVDQYIREAVKWIKRSKSSID